MSDATPAGQRLARLLRQLEDSLVDARLSDDEKRLLTQSLRGAELPEEGLRQLRNQAFDLVRSRLGEAEADPSALVRWLDGVARAIDTARSPGGPHRAQAYFSPGTDCLDVIVRQLRGCRQSADLCVFTLSDDRISAEVLAAHRRGVKVRLLTDNDKEFDAGSDVAALRDAGVPVRVDRTPAHMHHKFALLDRAWLINGSYNWTRSACQLNEENLVLCNDPGLLRQFGDAFEQLWSSLGPRA